MVAPTAMVTGRRQSTHRRRPRAPQVVALVGVPGPA